MKPAIENTAAWLLAAEIFLALFGMLVFPNWKKDYNEKPTGRENELFFTW